MNGLGVFTWPDGNQYIGQYLNDKRHGKGILKKANGDRFEGMWKDDVEDGLGEIIYANGDKKKIGKWENGTIILWIAE